VTREGETRRARHRSVLPSPSHARPPSGAGVVVRLLPTPVDITCRSWRGRWGASRVRTRTPPETRAATGEATPSPLSALGNALHLPSLIQPPPQGTATATANWDPRLGAGPVGRTRTPVRTIDITGCGTARVGTKYIPRLYR
jgi:hypothetical protein